ncbi:hypothetical protein [Oscillibacter sp. 1-3]|uniref:hypothetical protein n=1 Tax=Oscillibacter sp. 1-3 TaxID=1235797 RepID=UPI001FA72FBF|nr:hypothetical protein [Oscillibacter sp. 1-3]
MGICWQKALQTQPFFHGGGPGNSGFADYYAEPSEWRCIEVSKGAETVLSPLRRKGGFGPAQEQRQSQFEM